MLENYLPSSGTDEKIRPLWKQYLTFLFILSCCPLLHGKRVLHEYSANVARGFDS